MTRRALGRATLARQLLLERSTLGAVAAIEALGGMQAQEPRPPFVGLWSRLEGFEPAQLRDALRSGAVVRAPLMRGTLHLVSSADFGRFRVACQPALDVAARVLRDRAAGADLDAVCALARAALEDHPRTSAQMRELMAAGFPGSDARALAYLARMHVPVAMVPSEDEWGFPRDPALALAPARLLPAFDSLVLGHADRGRIIAPEHRPLLITKNLRIPATFLADGEIAGTWSVTRRGRSATLELAPFGRLATGARPELEREGDALLAAIEPGRAGEVRFTPR